jgi:hypothetical protein
MKTMRCAFFLGLILVAVGCVAQDAATKSDELGQLSANPYGTNSTSNPYSSAGSPYSSTSINNPYGKYGSPYSATSANNPYATDAPKLYGPDGKYLGKLSSNPYDPDSTSNPYGQYGSQYSPTSINNPYGKYGSQYSPESATNPYTQTAPVIVAPDAGQVQDTSSSDSVSDQDPD